MLLRWLENKLHLFDKIVHFIVAGRLYGSFILALERFSQQYFLFLMHFASLFHFNLMNQLELALLLPLYFYFLLVNFLGSGRKSIPLG